MKYNIAIMLFAAPIAILAQGAPQPRIKITSVQPNPWKIPEAAPEPGDNIAVDAATSDLVLTSRGTQLRVQLKNHVDPQFSVSYGRSANGLRYSYSLLNGRGARQSIEMFTMNILQGPVGSTLAPPYWWFVAKASDPGVTDITDPRLIGIMWGRLAKDWDENGRLVPGASAGPFVLESPGLPGLVTAYAQGWKPQPPPGQRCEECRIMDLSQWMIEQTNKLLRFPANAAKCNTIGPKISPSADRLTSVKAEIAYAAQLPDFASVQQALIAAAGSPTIATLQSALAKLDGTPLQKSFFAAMIFTLGY
jgi:hypothetical protein